MREYVKGIITSDSVKEVRQNLVNSSDSEYLRLWDTYEPLLTDKQREIAELYFNCDLSLTEIADEKNVSRQSVSDCLKKVRAQLEKYEEKLGFVKAMDDALGDLSFVLTKTGRYFETLKTKRPELKEEIESLEKEIETEVGKNG